MKRLFISLIFSLLLIVDAGAAWTVTPFGTSTNGSGATLTLGSITCAAGNLVVVFVDESGAGGTGTVADGSNTYSVATSQNFGLVGAIYYSTNITALSGATLTFTKQTSGDAASMTGFCASGNATSNVLDTPATNGNASGGCPCTVTSNAAAVTGELFVGLTGVNGATTFTQSSGFTNINAITTNPAMETGYLVNAGTTAQTWNPTVNTPTFNVNMIVAFKPGGGAAAAPIMRTLTGAGL